MASADKLKLALDDSRTLMLGAQVLLGFQMQLPFQPGFGSLSDIERGISLAALALMILAVGLLIAPSAFHRMTGGGASRRVEYLTSQMSSLTIAPFGLALSLDLALVANKVGGLRPAAVAAGVGLVITLGAWLSPWLFSRSHPASTAEVSMVKANTAQRIDFALTEARVVLPGVQALLGFQMLIVFTEAFTRLPDEVRIVHGLALAFIALAAAVLMAPAALHRIVYRGEEAPDFPEIAGYLLLAATALLAAGLSLDLYVVVSAITGTAALAIGTAMASGAVLALLWGVWPACLRLRSARPSAVAARSDHS